MKMISNIKVSPPSDPSPFAKYGKTIEFDTKPKSDAWHWAFHLGKYGDLEEVRGHFSLRLNPWYEDGVIKKVRNAFKGREQG